MRAKPSDFQFVSCWRIGAPQTQVWAAIVEPTRWPQWWPGLEAAELRTAGHFGGVGRGYRLLWRGQLPVRLPMDVEIIEQRPPERLTGRVDGRLVGEGRWRLTPVADTRTDVRFELLVNARKRALRLLAPVFRGLFEWNHQGLMRAGERGLNRYMDAASR